MGFNHCAASADPYYNYLQNFNEVNESVRCSNLNIESLEVNPTLDFMIGGFQSMYDLRRVITHTHNEFEQTEQSEAVSAISLCQIWGSYAILDVTQSRFSQFHSFREHITLVYQISTQLGSGWLNC